MDFSSNPGPGEGEKHEGKFPGVGEGEIGDWWWWWNEIRKRRRNW